MVRLVMVIDHSNKSQENVRSNVLPALRQMAEAEGWKVKLLRARTFVVRPVRRRRSAGQPVTIQVGGTTIRGGGAVPRRRPSDTPGTGGTPKGNNPF